MESIPGHDRWLDPPDPPTHGECAWCGEVFDFDDMTRYKDDWFCRECIEYLGTKEDEE